MGAIRELGKQVEALGKQVPSAAAEIQQIRTILRKLIMKVGAQAPTQNDSARALPMGG